MDTIEKNDLINFLMTILVNLKDNISKVAKPEAIEGIFCTVEMLSSRFDLGITIDKQEIKNKDGSITIFVEFKTNDDCKH